MRIFFKIFLTFLALFFISAKSFAITTLSYNSGLQERLISDPIRPLNIVVWYPTFDKKIIEQVGEDNIFKGVPAIYNAKIKEGNYPLILISHGLGGSWVNQAWLANALSQHGYIVASVNHPGTTAKNMDRIVAQDMLQRPKDITRTITYLLNDKTFSNLIDADKVSIIGHSYGGWTAIELIGGQFSVNQFHNQCKLYPSSISCKIFNQQMQRINPNSNLLKLEKNMSDIRIKTAITLDLSFARGFTSDSLSNIKIPVLVISSDNVNENDATEFESQYITKYLSPKNSQLISINNATHFSFIGKCKPKAIELLNKEMPNSPPICKESMKNRKLIHQKTINYIMSFFDNYMK